MRSIACTVYNNSILSIQDEVTALHIACFKGHNMIVRYLCLNKRLDVNKQDIVISLWRSVCL